MTDDQIIFVARAVRDGGHWNQLDLLNFGRIIALAEREACAKVCEDIDEPVDASAVGPACAKAIRTRGETK